MKGMTGFGHSEVKAGNIGVSAEIRSTNHRFLEAVFHLPEGFYYLEGRLRNLLEARFERGRVVVSISITGRPKQKVRVNRSLLKDYLRVMKSLRRDAGPDMVLNADTLLGLPGVLDIYEVSKDKNALASAIFKTALKALDGLLEMRSREGEAIETDLKSRISKISRMMVFIRGQFKKALERKLKKLKSPEEKSAFIKSSDITEELVRINYHLKSFRKNLHRQAPSGKEFDFIAQEMQREINTTGAKSIDALVSSSVVKIKSEVEKIREQLQNVE